MGAAEEMNVLGHIAALVNASQRGAETQIAMSQKTMLGIPRPHGDRARISFLNLTPARADFAATQDYMIKFGIAKEKVDLASYLDDRFARRKV